MANQETTGEKQPDPKYPSIRYNKAGETREVLSADEEADVDPNEWKDSPAAFGVETQPGRRADPDIAKNRPSGKGKG